VAPLLAGSEKAPLSGDPTPGGHGQVYPDRFGWMAAFAPHPGPATSPSSLISLGPPKSPFDEKVHLISMDKTKVKDEGSVQSFSHIC
jgi:hypothetical protein